MKKLCSVVLLFISGSIMANTVVIENETDGELSALVDYGAKGVCAPTSKTIAAHEDEAFPTPFAGGCCVDYIEFRSLSGRSAGKTTTFYPSGRFLRSACRPIVRVQVRTAADNSLIAQE